MAAANVFNVTDANFDQEILQSDTPVLVDFTATWCGPCKQIAPFIDQLADEYTGRMKVVKVDIDQSQKAASRFGIRGVPTLVVFKNGTEVARQSGAVPKATIKSVMDRGLAG